jgi:hypothetical protein
MTNRPEKSTPPEGRLASGRSRHPGRIDDERVYPARPGAFQADQPDSASMGPTTENAHSPTERLHVPSLHRIAEFMRALLASVMQN